MKPSVKLFGTKILVSLPSKTAGETKSAGGIIIPASANSEKDRTKWASVS